MREFYRARRPTTRARDISALRGANAALSSAPRSHSWGSRKDAIYGQTFELPSRTRLRIGAMAWLMGSEESKCRSDQVGLHRCSAVSPVGNTTRVVLSPEGEKKGARRRVRPCALKSLAPVEVDNQGRISQRGVDVRCRLSSHLGRRLGSTRLRRPRCLPFFAE